MKRRPLTSSTGRELFDDKVDAAGSAP